LTAKPPLRRRRWVLNSTIVLLIVLAAGIAVARVLLFSRGILYGESTAKMASLAVAAVVVTVGAMIIKIRQGDRAVRSAEPGPGSQPAGGQSTGPAQPGPGGQPAAEQSTSSVVSTLAVLLGLALTAYSAAELIAPNTPVAASAPACPGAPVYGAGFFAQTTGLGVNSRSGPGREYAQVNRYAANCTLGFDGYCVGSVERDLRLKTPR